MPRDIETVIAEKHEQLEDVLRRIGVTEHITSYRECIPASDRQGKIDTGWIMARIRNSWIPCRFWLEDEKPFDGFQFLAMPKDYRWVLVVWDEACAIDDGKEALRMWYQHNADIAAAVAKDFANNSADDKYLCKVADEHAKEAAKKITEMN